jgi:hypothetical protein
MTFFAKHKTIRRFFDFQELYSLTTSAEYADFCLLLRGIKKKFVPLQKLSVIS